MPIKTVTPKAGRQQKKPQGKGPAKRPVKKPVKPKPLKPTKKDAKPPEATPGRKDKDKNRPKPLGKGPGYASIQPEPGQTRAVQKWLYKVCGIKGGLPARSMHITLLYDDRNKRFDVEQRRGAMYPARPRTVALFGDHLVLLLDSPEVAARHQKLVDAGYKHTYPQYRPHITLKKGATDDDFLSAIGCLDKLLKQVPKMTLYRERWEKTNEDWKPAKR